MPDRPLPAPTDPITASSAVREHLTKALAGRRYEYDDDRTILLWLQAARPTGETDEYLVRLRFLHYPDWPPSVTFLNPSTRLYDATHWPAISGNPNNAFYPKYGDAPEGMMCNTTSFEYYFWGGHTPTSTIHWNKNCHTFAATIAELADNLRKPFYQGRQT